MTSTHTMLKFCLTKITPSIAASRRPSPSNKENPLWIMMRDWNSQPFTILSWEYATTFLLSNLTFYILLMKFKWFEQNTQFALSCCSEICSEFWNLHIPKLIINRGYYMPTQRYEISLRVLKNISRASAANKWNIFNMRKQPCSVLFII